MKNKRVLCLTEQHQQWALCLSLWPLARQPVYIGLYETSPCRNLHQVMWGKSFYEGLEESISSTSTNNLIFIFERIWDTNVKLQNNIKNSYTTYFWWSPKYTAHELLKSHSTTQYTNEVSKSRLWQGTPWVHADINLSRAGGMFGDNSINNINNITTSINLILPVLWGCYPSLRTVPHSRPAVRGKDNIMLPLPTAAL